MSSTPPTAKEFINAWNTNMPQFHALCAQVKHTPDILITLFMALMEQANVNAKMRIIYQMRNEMLSGTHGTLWFIPCISTQQYMDEYFTPSAYTALQHTISRYGIFPAKTKIIPAHIPAEILMSADPAMLYKTYIHGANIYNRMEQSIIPHEQYNIQPYLIPILVPHNEESLDIDSDDVFIPSEEYIRKLYLLQKTIDRICPENGDVFSCNMIPYRINDAIYIAYEEQAEVDMEMQMQMDLPYNHQPEKWNTCYVYPHETNERIILHDTRAQRTIHISIPILATMNMQKPFLQWIKNIAPNAKIVAKKPPTLLYH